MTETEANHAVRVAKYHQRKSESLGGLVDDTIQQLKDKMLLIASQLDIISENLREDAGDGTRGGS